MGRAILGLGMLVTALAVAAPAKASVSAQDATTAPPMITIVMSRSEISAADNMIGSEPTGTCTQDNQNITPLPWVLKWMSQNTPNVHLTGSVETATTKDTANWCAHYGRSLGPSWTQLQSFSSQYGMHFISHSADYPQVWSSVPAGWFDPYAGAYGSTLADWQNWETCGSRDAITAHGLLGALGQYDWPNQHVDATVDANDVSQCFYTERSYSPPLGSTYVNTLASVQASPDAHTSYTRQLLGGSCSEVADPTNPCRNEIPGANWYYTPPRQIINLINSLKPGQAVNLQAYVLVTNTNPDYATNADRWNCTNPNPAYHWTNDAERYCFADFQRIVQALQNDPNVVVTDPQGVSVAWGLTPPTR